MKLISLIGLFAAIFTSASTLPQSIKTIKSKSAKDISLLMCILLFSSVLLWFIYGILKQDLPVALGNGFTMIFTFIILLLKIKHG